MLEVMAAVLVLGLLYSVLADVAIEGLRAEGEAKRRLDASLMVDRLLGDMEAEMSIGVLPEEGVSQWEEDPYRIEREVAPLSLPLELVAIIKESDPESPFASDEAGATGILRVDLRVSWDEASRELSVARTTFTYDAAQYAAIAEGADAGEGEDEGAAGTEAGSQMPGNLPQEMIDFGRSLGLGVQGE